MTSKTLHPALDQISQQGLVRARDLALLGVTGGTLEKMLITGSLVRLGRGIYAAAGRTQTELDDYAQITIKYPRLVFCLLTALQVHGLTTQSPHSIWVAIGQKARAPKIDNQPLLVVRMSDLDFGITMVTVDGVIKIPVTDIAKTIADCFKFRNKIGIDIALEALREAWQQKKVTMDEIWLAAEHCRVSNVMRPYLESLL